MHGLQSVAGADGKKGAYKIWERVLGISGYSIIHIYLRLVSITPSSFPSAKLPWFFHLSVKFQIGFKAPTVSFNV